MVWKPVRQREDWGRDRGSGLTLIVADDEIIKLGWTSRRGWEGASGQKLEVSRIESVVPPIPYAKVTGRIAPRFATHLPDKGRLGAGTGQALVEALTQERPHLGGVIARIEGVADKYPIRDSPAGQVMALQRDASIVAVRMAGMDVSDFARWDRPTDRLAIEDVPPTFVGRTQGDRQLEERLIQHDGETMLGWLTQKTHHTSWRAFSGFGQRLLVANANNDTAEHTLGVDLIYYNVSRGSIILVQYKKLNAKNNGSFYPDSDSNLADEIQRMQKLNQYVTANRSPYDDFRLEPSPCWMKLCQDQAYIPQTADMIPGMYFSLGHFQQLREDPRLKGAQGAVRFAYDNVPSYLDNTMFARLVETGFVGTSGTATELVHQQIAESFNGNKALVLAALFGEDIPSRNATLRSATSCDAVDYGFVARVESACTPAPFLIGQLCLLLVRRTIQV